MSCACETRKPIQTVVIDLSVTAITSAAWVQLLAALTYAATKVEIFNGCSSAFSLGVGSAGNEVALPYTVLPGGTAGAVSLSKLFPAGARITAKSIGGTPAQGLLIFNFYG